MDIVSKIFSKKLWQLFFEKLHKRIMRWTIIRKSYDRYQYRQFQKSIIILDKNNKFFLIDHNIGGGTGFYRQEIINTQLQKNRIIILLYFDIYTNLYNLHFINKNSSKKHTFYYLETFASVLIKLKCDQLFLNHCYTFPEPLAILQQIKKIQHQHNTKITIAIHDYYAVCPSYNLLDFEKKYCNIPNIKICKQCLPKNQFSFLTRCKDIEIWRSHWQDFLKSVDEVICFSHSSVKILLEVYPCLEIQKVKLQPHKVDYLLQNKPDINLLQTLHIGIVGNINFQKGADIIANMVNIIKLRNLPIKITIIGSYDKKRISPILKVTGRYKRDNLSNMIEKSGANIFFISSISPETFSYVTEELIQLDVPVAVFNIGAPPERVIKYKKGLLINKIEPSYALDAIINFHKKLIETYQTQPVT